MMVRQPWKECLYVIEADTTILQDVGDFIDEHCIRSRRLESLLFLHVSTVAVSFIKLFFSLYSCMKKALCM
jgi:hypothetical protein